MSYQDHVQTAESMLRNAEVLERLGFEDYEGVTVDQLVAMAQYTAYTCKSLSQVVVTAVGELEIRVSGGAQDD